LKSITNAIKLFTDSVARTNSLLTRTLCSGTLKGFLDLTHSNRKNYEGGQSSHGLYPKPYCRSWDTIIQSSRENIIESREEYKVQVQEIS